MPSGMPPLPRQQVESLRWPLLLIALTQLAKTSAFNHTLMCLPNSPWRASRHLTEHLKLGLDGSPLNLLHLWTTPLPETLRLKVTLDSSHCWATLSSQSLSYLLLGTVLADVTSTPRSVLSLLPLNQFPIAARAVKLTHTSFSHGRPHPSLWVLITSEDIWLQPRWLGAPMAHACLPACLPACAHLHKMYMCIVFVHISYMPTHMDVVHSVCTLPWCWVSSWIALYLLKSIHF